MIRIEHVALWVANLEKMRRFYVEVLGGESGPEYVNSRTGFRSCFVTLGDGARLELMRGAAVASSRPDPSALGFAHVAVSVGSQERVDDFTEQLRRRGVVVVSEPRRTGDGYYESVIEDPEGNRIEITI